MTPKARRSTALEPRIDVPAHIGALVAALAGLRPTDRICDPDAGGCELLNAAIGYVLENFPAMVRDTNEQAHLRERMFCAFGVDREANLGALQDVGVDRAQLSADDVLSRSLDEQGARYTRVLTRLPFSGRRETTQTAKDLLRILRSTRPELLLLARALQLLAPGGRAVMIVPEHVLSGTSKTQLRLRSLLVETHKVEAVVALPEGVFTAQTDKPASILVVTRTDAGGTEHVWFYGVRADGLTLDAKRDPLLAAEKLGPSPRAPLSDSEHEQNNLPDVLARWHSLHAASTAQAELERPRSAQSFCVAKSEIAAQGYDLSIRRYQVAMPAHMESRRPHEILAELAGIEAEIFQGMKDLVGMLR